MDGQRFDELTKAALARATRRRAIAGALAAVAGAGFGLGGQAEAQERCGRGERQTNGGSCRCAAGRCNAANGAGRFDCCCTTTVDGDSRCANDSLCFDTEPCATDRECRSMFGPSAFCQAPGATACFEASVCGLPCGERFPPAEQPRGTAAGVTMSGR